MSKQIAISLKTWNKLRAKQTQMGLTGNVPSYDDIINEFFEKEEKQN